MAFSIVNCEAGSWASSTASIWLCHSVWTWIKTCELAQPRKRRQEKHAICNKVLLAPKPLHMFFMSFLLASLQVKLQLGFRNLIFSKLYCTVVFLLELASSTIPRLQSLPIREMVDAGWSCDGWCSATLPSDCLVLRGPRYRPDSSKWLVLIHLTPPQEVNLQFLSLSRFWFNICRFPCLGPTSSCIRFVTIPYHSHFTKPKMSKDAVNGLRTSSWRPTVPQRQELQSQTLSVPTLFGCLILRLQNVSLRRL